MRRTVQRGVRPGVRRGLVPAVGALILLAPVAVASAVPAAAVPAAAPVEGTGSSLPSYDTWLRDVAVVAGDAGAHLSGRLTDPAERTAVVLDIDNTALATAYARNGGSVPATDPVLAVVKRAKASGAAVFFVTARGESLASQTRANLSAVGYPVDGLYLRPARGAGSLQQYKTSQRVRIENLGYTIVANIGNNATDLAGGHAEYTAKLPDYDGLLG